MTKQPSRAPRSSTSGPSFGSWVSASRAHGCGKDVSGGTRGSPQTKARASWKKTADARVRLAGYDGELRQITVLRRPGSRRRPALLLTNDFDSTLSQLLRRYARRWLIEKSIAEQLDFFHLNRLSSSMVIKVDLGELIALLTHGFEFDGPELVVPKHDQRTMSRLNVAPEFRRISDSVPRAGEAACQSFKINLDRPLTCSRHA